jgi:hypothetical protein
MQAAAGTLHGIIDTVSGGRGAAAVHAPVSCVGVPQS